MAKPFYIQEGVVSTAKKKGGLAQLFDVKKWTTDLLIDYGLIGGDPCCVSGGTGITGNISNAKYSVFTGIAASGITAADATVLEYGVNVVEISDVNNIAVKLPQPVTGKSVKIINMTGIPIYVFPSNPGGKINNLPIDAHLVIPADGATYEFICTENPLPGNWNIVSVPGSSSYTIQVTINHVNGVDDDIAVNSSGVITSALSMYPLSTGGASFTLNPNSSAWFTLNQPARSTYLKVYSNIITTDLGPNFNDGVNVIRQSFFVESLPGGGYQGISTWGDEILFLQDNTGSQFSVMQVTNGPTPASSPAAAIGDDTTLYSELPATVWPYIGTTAGLASVVSPNVYSYYRITIPASAATKNYQFYIVQEYI